MTKEQTRVRECSLSSRRPAVFKAYGGSKQADDEDTRIHRNYYINQNKERVTRTKMNEMIRKRAVQDTRNGHCQLMESSGLQPKYVFKKDFGKIPEYLKKLTIEAKKTDDEKISSEEKAKEDSKEFACVGKVISEEEKQTLLNGLITNMKIAEKEYSLLPVVTDTLSKRNRRQILEDRLKSLERDMSVLKINHPILIVAD